MFRRWVLPYLVFLFYRLLTLSWRKVLIEHEDLKLAFKNKTPIILAHWHGDELALIHLVRPYRLATMTSMSQDGDVVDFVIRKFGGATSRGSSSRGGIGALKGLIRLVRSGHTASIAVDGPRGPYHQVKPGVFELSKLAKAHIVPVGVCAPSSFIFKKSWNKALLPLPFTKVGIYFGKPQIKIDSSTNPKDLRWRDELTAQLVDANHQASKIIAGT